MGDAKPWQSDHIKRGADSAIDGWDGRIGRRSQRRGLLEFLSFRQNLKGRMGRR